MIPQELSV